jgi:transcriptional regulator with XRE-family HTH domain
LARIIIKVKDRAEENIHIGSYIKQFRESSGISQYELGKAIGLSEDIAQQQIDKYENCLVRVPIDVFFRITKTLNVKVDININNNTIEFTPRKDS